MDRDLLKNVEIPEYWNSLPTSYAKRLGLNDDEDMACLGIYQDKKYGSVVFAYSYGEDYDEFLDAYLGLLYDNDSDQFVQSSERLSPELKMKSIYLQNHVLGQRRYMINIFKIAAEITSYCVQFFVVYKDNLLNITTYVGNLDAEHPYYSLLSQNPAMNTVFEFLKKL